jgi:crotonobetainyl-CoA:carnitine CoA-transferase CaiB-like acyl-CoA transferase
MTTMLSHLRVIDLTGDLGRYTGKLLADLGADVLRIESREHVADAASIAWDTGKRFIKLDLTQSTDRQALRDLIGRADVLIRNTVTEPFTHADLAASHPGLIDVVVRAFDPNGNATDRPATDLTLMARSGLASIVGDPDRAPMTLPGEQAFALAGAQGAVAVLTALHARHADGKGQLVTVSALQSAVLANYREPLMWQFAGRIGRRTGNLLVRGKSGVRQIWPCRDGYVTWSLVDNPGMMRAMVKVMRDCGMAADLAEVDWDSTLIADTPREILAAWEGHVEAFFRNHSRGELSQWSVAHGLGLSPIDDVEDVLSSEQLRSRSMWRQVDGPNASKVLVPGPLFVTSEFDS